MDTALTPLRLRDLRLLALLAGCLISIALHLGAGPGTAETSASGWRRIDTAAVTARMDSGDLSRREALWYHATRPGERPGGAEGR